MEKTEGIKNILDSVKRGYSICKLLESKKEVSVKEFNENMITQLIIDIINLKMFGDLYTKIGDENLNLSDFKEFNIQEINRFTHMNHCGSAETSPYESLLNQLIMIKAKHDDSKIKKLYGIYINIVNYEWKNAGLDLI